MKVFVVREQFVDYDDYPIGSGIVLFVTADEDRARRETAWPRTTWTPHPKSMLGKAETVGGRRFTRQLEILEVEDLDQKKGS